MVVSLSSKTWHVVSPEKGQVTVSLEKFRDDLFGDNFKMYILRYENNGRQVVRKFDTDTCGMIKFRNACNKLGIRSDYALI